MEWNGWNGWKGIGVEWIEWMTFMDLRSPARSIEKRCLRRGVGMDVVRRNINESWRRDRRSNRQRARGSANFIIRSLILTLAILTADDPHRC